MGGWGAAVVENLVGDRLTGVWQCRCSALRSKTSWLTRVDLISHDAKREFERYATARGTAIASMTPRAAVEEMLAFYRAVRAEDCDIESSGDMLLFQWGTYDWGAGPWFEFDITRQLSRSGEDEDIWQLHITFRFDPTDELRSLGAGNRWCQSIDGLVTFSEFVRSTRVFQDLADRADVQPDLDYECAG